MDGLGERILSHYEKYLGQYVGADQYTDGGSIIQLLGYDGVFEGCLVFATLGLSKCSDAVGRVCELICAADSDWDECAEVLMNAVFCAVTDGIRLGCGSVISGIESISEEFAASHGKSAVYFTGNCLLPEGFSDAGGCEMLTAFFVSGSEARHIIENGPESFEDLLEQAGADITVLDRPPVI